MTEIVTVATFKRNELLWLCLEAIRREDAAIDVTVWADRGWHDQELEQTCLAFSAHLFVQKPHSYYGNSFNVLESLRWGLRSGAQIHHSLEDDTIIHRGYFDFIRPVLATGRYACALGRVPGDIGTTWYTSPAVSWDVGALKQCLDLIPFGYITERREDMQKVLDAAFSKSKFVYGSAEQDGLFLRCLESLKLKSWYPPYDLASHLGFFSFNYNRDWDLRPQGTFEERIAACRKVLHDREKRTELFGARITENEMGGMLR